MCDCQVCQQGREFKRRLELVPEPERPYWNDLYETLIHAEMDRDWYRAIFDGSWPDARRMLLRAARRAKGG